MTLDEYNTYCASLSHTTHVVQWGNSHVWKVGGKVFAIAGWGDRDDLLAITFKTSPMSYDILKEQDGLRPAPYLASRGMKWIQHHDEPGLDPQGLKDYIAASYDLVVQGLTKKLRRELGLLVE